MKDFNYSWKKRVFALMEFMLYITILLFLLLISDCQSFPCSFKLENNHYDLSMLKKELGSYYKFTDERMVSSGLVNTTFNILLIAVDIYSTFVKI